MITLYSRNPRIIKNVRDMCMPEQVTVNERDIPVRADVLVTMSGLNCQIELYAGSLGAQCVVLPEGRDWLWARIKAGRWSVLAGADMYNAIPKVRR